MKKILLFISILSALVSSCQKGDTGKEGDPGPGYYKTANGSITATIHYKYPNGDTAIVPCTYDSYLSEQENTLNMDTASTNQYPYYSFSLVRYNADDASDFISISSCWSDYDRLADTSFLDPYNFIFGISRVASGSTLFAFSTMSDVYNMNQLQYYYVGEEVTISNYYLNPTTHRLTFDYEVVLSPNVLPYQLQYDSYVSPIVKGKVDLTLIKSPYVSDVCYYFD